MGGVNVGRSSGRSRSGFTASTSVVSASPTIYPVSMRLRIETTARIPTAARSRRVFGTAYVNGRSTGIGSTTSA